MEESKNSREVESKMHDIMFLDHMSLFITTDDFVPKIIDTLKISKEYFGSGDRKSLDTMDSNFLNNDKKRFNHEIKNISEHLK